MTRLCVGLLAPVDAGKTTLSEAMLYAGGQLRRLGRVDHGDAFLDTDELERERGITIFSKQALLPLPELSLTLLDTPGHVDFSSEMERTLQVLDCAVLVVSGTDGVQGHTLTLWRLLARHKIPTFLFVNKMDLAGAERNSHLLLAQLKARLDGSVTDFTAPAAALFEETATGSEEVLEEYLDTGAVSDASLARLVERRAVFPCFFGAALRLDGVDKLLDGLTRYAPRRHWPEQFGARIFKISRDPQGTRLTWLKVTGGALKVKGLLTNRRAGLAEDKVWEEKADQLRLYSGAKYTAAERVEPGQVCAVVGLSAARAGEGLGIEALAEAPVLEPVLSYRLVLPLDADPFSAFRRLGQLEEEDPQLHLVWWDGEIHLQLMGQVQLEILRRRIAQRFGLEVDFDRGQVSYRETIAGPVEGVGHFEPLRHYAEVHLLLEPLEPGAGVQVATLCPEDELDGHWQRLILTHLLEREHRGVLTGSPLTDVRLTLLSGRASVKHTEGGDFRQATYRAVRQGLMQAQSVLLEPWYDFRLELPADLVGRAMTDIQRRGGDCGAPETIGDTVLLAGKAPVAGLENYAAEVAAYSGGRGRLSCVMRGYEPCRDQERVVEELGYDPERDVDNPPDSVFCAHGAGFLVKWNEVPNYMHLPAAFQPEVEADTGQAAEPRPSSARTRGGVPGSLALDRELEAIFERTYGPVKRGDFRPAPKPAAHSLRENWEVRLEDSGPEYLLVDGYNVIFAWDDLKALARESLDGARARLMELLSNYRGYRSCEVILVFDAYKVPHGTGDVAKYHNIYVVYTKEAETADAYIEKATYELGKKHRVRVVTSDGVEQLIILGHGALRVSARSFRAELDGVNASIAAAVRENNRQEKSRPVQAAMERARGK